MAKNSGSVVAWVLMVVFAVAAGALGFLFVTKAASASNWQGAMQEVVTTAGLPAVEPSASAGDVAQQVQQSIQAMQQELTAAKDAAAAAQAAEAGLREEIAAQSRRADEQAAAAKASAAEVATQKESLLAAQAASAKAIDEVTAAKETAARYENALEELKTQNADELARLQAELDAARDGELFDGDMSVDSEVQELTPEEEALAEQDEANRMRMIGQSSMIEVIRYTEKEQSLFIRLLDGQELVYVGVTQELYDQLIENPAKLDVVFRFKIQGKLDSDPPDGDVMSRFFKWQRRRGRPSDVWVVDPPKAAAAPVAPAAEAPVAEAPAAE